MNSAPAPNFNLGNLADLVAEAVPDRTAVLWGDVKLTYRELKERSDRLAAALLRRGIKRGDRVGLLMFNSSHHLEALLATFKIGAIEFNLNYRYVGDELLYIINDAGASALIYDDDFHAVVDDILPRCRPAPIRIPVGGRIRAAEGVFPYEAAVSEPVGDADIKSGRSSDDLTLLYTGGTTGSPKGVEWTHESMFFACLGGAGGMFFGPDPIKTPETLAVMAKVAPSLPMSIIPPMMHGAALWTVMGAVLGGHKAVIPKFKHFDPDVVWDVVSHERVLNLSVIGDAMLAPLIDAWDAHPGRWDAASLRSISWGGAPVSEHLRRKARERFPHINFSSGHGSSESGAVGLGEIETGGDGFLKMPPRPHTAVIVDGVRFANPGETGILARTGYLPRGYWRDPEKTSRTFVTVGDKRWVLTGDRARLDADGTMTLYGRDSTCINSGGEKIYPEEVEAAVRSHPAVTDAIVVGVPDPRWGEAVSAVVSLREGAQINLGELRDYCAAKLARYKLPHKLVVQSELKRSPAGKPDLRWAKSIAATA